jgi:hypothetical protein
MGPGRLPGLFVFVPVFFGPAGIWFFPIGPGFRYANLGLNTDPPGTVIPAKAGIFVSNRRVSAEAV